MRWGNVEERTSFTDRFDFDILTTGAFGIGSELFLGRRLVLPVRVRMALGPMGVRRMRMSLRMRWRMVMRLRMRTMLRRMMMVMWIVMMWMMCLVRVRVRVLREMPFRSDDFGHVTSAPATVVVGVVMVVAIASRFQSALTWPLTHRRRRRHLFLVMQLWRICFGIVDCIVSVIGPRAACRPPRRCHHLPLVVLSGRIGR